MIAMTPREPPDRTMVAVKPATRNRLNKFVVRMCFLMGYKISQDTALNLLLDKFEKEVEDKGIVAIMDVG